MTQPRLSLVILNQSLSPRRIAPGLRFSIESFSHSVRGGPLNATVHVDGDELARRELINYLGSPVEIVDPVTGPCWWGYIGEATTVMGDIEIGASLTDTANRIAVAYTDNSQTATANKRATTAWTDDADSQNRWGVKERLENVASANPTQAAAIRDRTLAYFKNPIPVIRDAKGADQRATLQLKGWYGVLDWRYYTAAEDNTAHNFPSDWTNNYLVWINHTDWMECAQSFTPSASYHVDTLLLHGIRGALDTKSINFKVGTAASAGGTQTVLGSYTTDFIHAWPTWGDNWSAELPLSPSFDVVSGQQYWIWPYVSAGGGEGSMFALALEAGSGFYVSTYVGAWSSYLGGSTCFFNVKGKRDSTVLIADTLAGANQFITSALIENLAGIYCTGFRAGDETAKAVIDQMLVGGTSNNRRLVAVVMRDRVLRVFEEPAGNAANARYKIRRDGALYRRIGNTPVPPSESPVGQWCAIEGETPPLSAVGAIDMSAFVIETATWQAGEHRWTIEPRGVVAPLEFYRAIER